MDRVGRAAAVRLLDVDGELAEAVPEGMLREAQARSLVRVLELDEGGCQWDPAEMSSRANAGWLGLLVLDGLLIRQASVASRTTCEIFGPGDLLRPWDADGEYEPLAITVGWTALAPTRLTVLDDAFARRMAPWPGIVAELTRRLVARARHLAVLCAVTHLPRTHARLLLTFWLLADRWGTVTPDGVLIKLPLTHQILATIVGNHRPSVTIGLKKLAQGDLLVRRSPREWLLTHNAIERMHQPESLSLLDMQPTD